MVNSRMPGWRVSDLDRSGVTACSLAKLTFGLPDVPSVRRFATSFGASAGFGPGRLTDFALAVSEAAACAVSHGPCAARLRLWTIGSRAFCEIYGDGAVRGQGPRAVDRSDAEKVRRWVLRQLCDHVLVECGPHGVTVRFSMTVGAGAT